MTRSDVLFGFGDLAERMAALVGPEAPDAGPATDGPPTDEPTVYVHVGQLYSAAQPSLVSTILGSCVAVCLWDGAAGVGGLNHYLLPQPVSNGISSPRFGNVAIEQLIAQVAKLGGDPRRLKAKVFGGASVLDAFQAERRSLGMGNVDLARRLLREAKIPIVAEDVGGTEGRRVLFHTGDGTAWVRKI
jgi:chemotaxis protein CheD